MRIKYVHLKVRPILNIPICGLTHPNERLGESRAVGDAVAAVSPVSLPVLVVGSVVVHVLLQVHVEVLEDHVELVVRVHHVQQLHHVLVLKLLQQRDLADRGRGDALRFSAEEKETVSDCKRVEGASGRTWNQATFHNQI